MPPSLWNVLNEISQVQKNRKITFDQKRKNIRNKEQYEETT